jgi:hypothetical protein
MSYETPRLFRTISVVSNDAIDLPADLTDGFDECLNELAQGFVSFSEKNYVESSEVKLYHREHTHVRISYIFLFDRYSRA